MNLLTDGRATVLSREMSFQGWVIKTSQVNRRALTKKTNTDNWTSCAACRETRRYTRSVDVHMKLFSTRHAQDVLTSLHTSWHHCTQGKECPIDTAVSALLTLRSPRRIRVFPYKFCDGPAVCSSNLVEKIARSVHILCSNA